MIKRFTAILAITLMVLSTSGCYFQTKVSQNEVGVQMSDGVKVSQIVGPGRHSAWGWYAAIEDVDVSVKTTIWSGADIWTSDKQPISFDMSVAYSRDSSMIEDMWGKYNLECRNDEALEKLVHTRIPRVVKSVSTSMTLDQMLGISDDPDKNRTALQKNIYDQLKEELADCGIILQDAGVNNIGADPDYVEKLKQKASAGIAVELAAARTKELAEQLNQEKAQTDIDVEKARRNNLVKEEESKVFAQSPETYELERLKLLQGLLKDTDKVYFVPEGADITLLLGNSQTGTPIISGQ